MTDDKESKHGARCVASLRVGGDWVVPDRITHLLGCEPTGAHAKGSLIKGKKTGREHRAHTGSWRLRAANGDRDLNEQIAEILGRLRPDPDIWADLAREFRIDMFCGVFLNRWNDWLTLRPETMASLAARKIELALDIYSHLEEEEPPPGTGTASPS